MDHHGPRDLVEIADVNKLQALLEAEGLDQR
jgi:hypothetical protein